MGINAMRRLSLVLAGVATVVGTVTSQTTEAAVVASSIEGEEPIGMELSLTPGAHWLRSWTFFLVPTKSPPQHAAWVEDLEGEYLGTLAVTDSAAKSSWKAAPKEGRPEALPVWSRRSGAAGSAPANGGVVKDSDAVLDAVSGATPKGETAIKRALTGLRRGERYRAFLEVNHSFDYNERWPRKAKEGESGWSGVNGQPSVVYAAEFVAGSGEPVAFEPVGQGSVDGSDGELRPTLDGLTSALDIIARSTVTSR